MKNQRSKNTQKEPVGPSYQGFSILELLILLLMVSTLIASMQSRPRSKTFLLRQASNELRILLEQAKARSQHFGQHIRVTVQGSRLSVTDGEHTFDTLHIPQSLHLSSSQASLSFTPHGTNQPGRFSMRSHGYRCAVSISLFGQIGEQCR